jgi:NitT/TauT family transport system permease protein
LSPDAVEPEEILAAPRETPATGVAGRARSLQPLGTLAAVVGVALAALAINLGLPDGHLLPMTWLDPLPWWLHPYPVLLVVGMAATSAWAVGQGAWPRLRPGFLETAPLVAGALAVLAVWDFVTVKTDWLPTPFFPGPDEVLGALIEDRAVLAVNTWYSLQLLLCGYGVGVTAGLVCGVLIGWFPAARYWAMPVLKVFGPVPATALVPLVMTLFPASLSFASGAALIAFAVWFPMTVLTSSGIANVNLSYLDVARTLGAGRLYLIFRVALPSALPNIFLGLFMGLGASFLTLIVAETVGVKGGLGAYLQLQKGYTEYGKVYAALVIMMVFFSTLMTVLFKVRDWVLRWQKGVLKW